MDVKMRCQSIRGTAQADQIVTERTFVSTDNDGNQLNADVTNASYQDTQTGPAGDTSIQLNEVVTFAIGVPPVVAT